MLLALFAAAYGIFLLGRTAATSTRKKVAATDSSLIDQTPFETAGRLAQLADTPDEQELAKEALRLSDNELDLSLAVALQDAEAHPPALSAVAKQILARLERNQKVQQALEAQVGQLTAQVSKATGPRQSDLQDQLDIAKASLDVASNDVDDAKRDLTAAGGNQHERIEMMRQAHEAADKSRKSPDQIFPPPAAEKPGLLHYLEQWSALHEKKKLLLGAKADADRLCASLTAQHNALDAQVEVEKLKSPDLAAHSKQASLASASGPLTDDSLVASITGNISRSRSADEKKAALATTKAITLDQKNLASLDKRVDNERELSETYAGWLAIVSGRQREVIRRILIGASIVLAIALVGLFFNTWLDRVLGTIKIDRRQIQTLRTTAQVSVEILAVLLVLLVIFGPPGQLGTFLGLAGAGLTVALKDFIVGFLGWFVLMGRNGIRLGDWVEINGVTGEVVEIGLFHTVLLETGNWTDSGHPTGRRVTFTNSYAIEGHYFNFSTSGQWLWDELQLVLPTGEDPYPMIEAIQKRVLEATEESAKEAAREWKGAAGNRDIGAFSAEPAINLKPVLGGIELSVRYITQANQRSQLRTKLNQAAVDLLGKRGRVPEASPAAPSPRA
jgi:small-conductance mechanosensitive channel